MRGYERVEESYFFIFISWQSLVAGLEQDGQSGPAGAGIDGWHIGNKLHIQSETGHNHACFTARGM
jgi:hypothetical protein